MEVVAISAMYDVNLTKSYFQSQSDINVMDLSIGDVLKETAAHLTGAEDLVRITRNGEEGRRWTYGELFKESVDLAHALASRFEKGSHIVIWAQRLGPERAKRMLFTGDKINGVEAENIGLVLKSVPKVRLNAEVELLAQKMATLFDGISRHSPEGIAFKERVEKVSWKQAVGERDNGTFDWTNNQPI
ncbi:MAG: hypothetical protein HOH59_09625 [Rhodospirillaceae bacterium]|nr:hypothetical protein [Rhodospirillaceae bacterium]